ncbi:MAG: type II toxin-antitoxin system PemK/MazF family toxin [Pyrinomonadaceae bacterium]|nr:type II toxin-antitoxin system PemK/MazF family toxin [Pyrinomonadaceae bacterium]
MKAGDVVIALFEGVQGIKPRPAIVISTDFYHAERPDTLLALVTTRIDKAVAATDVILHDWVEAGLDRPSAVRMFLNTQEQTGVRVVGTLSERDWTEVRDRVRRSIAF